MVRSMITIVIDYERDNYVETFGGNSYVYIRR